MCPSEVAVTTMQVIPAIDLRGGFCVRLRLRATTPRKRVFGDDPAAMAADWEAQGATRIHLVDLDGAKAGRPVNVQAVRSILGRVSVPCQLGGGVRSEATVREWLGAGIERVIVGTQALKDPAWFRAMAAKYPRHRLVLGLDARDGRVATEGWLDVSSPVDATDLALQFDDLPIAGVVYTDIACDGMLEGPNPRHDWRTARRLDARDRLRRGRDARRPGAAGRVAGRGLHRRACPV